MKDITILSIAGGGSHSACLSSTGNIYTWGNGIYGQLGQGLDRGMVTEPAIVTKLRGKDITSIACGQNHSMFLSSSGHVYACGNGYYGQLGLDQEIDYVGVRRKKHLVYASRSDVASSARHHASRLRRDLHALRREQQRTHRQRVAGDERRRVRRQPTQVRRSAPSSLRRADSQGGCRHSLRAGENGGFGSPSDSVLCV